MKAEKAPESRKPFQLGKNEIVIRESIGPKRIDVSKEYRVSAGSTEFDVVIEFGHLYREMAGSKISEGERWTDYQNGDARILANHPEKHVAESVTTACETITHIAKTDSVNDPIAVDSYSRLVNALTLTEGNEVSQEIEGSTPIVALRAGYPMTKALGFSDNDMIMLDAKRLNDKKDSTKLALGLRFIGDKAEIMKKLKAANGNFVNADPALATGSTQLGILLWLLSNDVDVKNFTALSIGAAQQGLQMLNTSVEALRAQGRNFSFNTVSAGLHPELTAGEHPYYIKTKDGDYAVGDGGDFLDLVLPGELRKRWAETVTAAHITELSSLCPSVHWEDYLSEGENVVLPLMVKVQQLINKSSKEVIFVGGVFQKE